jgi:RNA polymerase sigma-70 factor (ECF subfamily)
VRRRVEPHTWEAFRLTAVEGMSGAEAAARLGLKVATVFKAKSKVRAMLQEEVARMEGA